MDGFLCIHIVTYIFIVAIVRVLLHFTNKNLYIWDFLSMQQTQVILGFNERYTPREFSTFNYKRGVEEFH